MPTDQKTYLRNRRGGFKGRITAVQNELQLISDENPISLARAQSMLESIKIAYEKFDSVQAELEQTDEEELQSPYRGEVDQLFDNVRYQLVDIIEEKKNQKTSQATDNRPKLPDLTVPKFDGDVLKWVSFKKVFNDVVIERENLDNVSKYQYLETSTAGGRAYELVTSVTGSDFQTAWSKLEEEYNHMGIIREKHIKDLYEVDNCDGSSTGLQTLLDKIESNLNSLTALQVDVSNWDLLLVHHLSTKLDKRSRKELESMKKPDSNVTYAQFKDFIKNRIRVMSAMESVTSFDPPSTSTPVPFTRSKPDASKRVSKQKVFAAREIKSCPLCNESHSLFQCASFTSMTVQDRQNIVRSKRVCFNCLSPAHWSTDCPSSNKCKKCSKQHHTLLCLKVESPNQSQMVASATHSVPHKRIILATATVLVENPVTGQSTICRAFLDGGATTNFITEHIVQSLSLPKLTSFTEISGINDTTTVNKHKVIAIIKSRTSNFTEEVDLLVSRKIVSDLPSEPIELTGLNIQNIDNLADPEFHSPGKIDILLGASIFFKIISGDKRELSPGLYMLPSQFGNIIVGQTLNNAKATAFCSIQSLQEQITKFWSIEQTENSNCYTLTEKLAEKHFQSTFFRCNTGKYSLGLPFNDKQANLGDSKQKTKMCFLRQEKNLQNDPEKYQNYRDFINEMFEMDHLEEVIEDGKQENYISHHIISRPSSTTTKHRVVFNASLKTTSNISLNDCLLIGPTIQKPIFTHLLKWRENCIAITADIAKMYRQIWHHESDRNFLKIWWRSSPDEELKAYRIKCVTYGTASAPFSAIRTLHQLAFDEVDNFPHASKMLLENFYVDDFVASFRTVDDAIQMKESITALLASGGFDLRKFSSNSNVVVPNPTEGENVKTLGVNWSVKTDQIILEFGNVYLHSMLTKSSVLSEIAQLFDPLGLCSPIVLKAKTIMQRIWVENNIQWDSQIPDDIHTDWINFRTQLKQMAPIHVERSLIKSSDVNIQIHGFCDASQVGYGACVYIRTESGSNLMCAKSRVAPLKRLTIPRLELQGALLLARLVNNVVNAITTKCQIFLWSDSEINLFRIKSSPNRFCTFVGTRLSEIQELTSPSNWLHIPTKMNPADVCSRGLMPDELASNDLWWHGPSFLTNENETWPSQKKFDIDETLLEFKVQAEVVIEKNDDLTSRFSVYQKMLRVISYIMRFKNITLKHDIPDAISSKPITCAECRDALYRIVRYCQNLMFKDDIKLIKAAKPLPKNSRLFRLNPFIDEQNILRVGGRLNNSKLNFDNQHQIILSDKMHLSRLILEHFHRINIHCGPLTLLNTSRQTFWIINGRNLSRKVVHDCIVCFRNKPRLIQQIMGQLPESRLNPIRPFHTVGIDFCGYFLIKNAPRAKVITKTYICLFTCFVTRATHLELVHDLTTEAFLAALRRFISRRGIPAHIHSDNGTNFVGGDRQLSELKAVYTSQLHQKQVDQFCCDNSIQWHFIPPKSPHFGALWESSVKQAKYHLKRSVREMLFTVEQLSTIVCQIEAILNSRPLTPLSDDPNDFKALTPGHFLIGQELNALPEPSLLDLNVNRLSVWQKLQFVTQDFWKKWHRDYINSLQCRQKWTTQQPNVKVGQLVLIAEDNIPVQKWLLGRIINIHPGQDNVVRVVSVKTQNNVFKRSVVKIAPLPIEPQNQNE